MSEALKKHGAGGFDKLMRVDAEGFPLKLFAFHHRDDLEESLLAARVKLGVDSNAEVMRHCIETGLGQLGIAVPVYEPKIGRPSTEG